MWIIQEPKKEALWNKQHFEEKNRECAACLKYSVRIFVEKVYKIQHLKGSDRPVLYIGRTVLKGERKKLTDIFNELLQVIKFSLTLHQKKYDTV
jgi:hypothetical protein